MYFDYYLLLEDTARYPGLILAPAEGFGQGWEQKRAYYAVLGYFWSSVVTLVTFSSNLVVTLKVIQKNQNYATKKMPKKKNKIK